MSAKPFRSSLRMIGLPGILGDIARVCGDAVAVRFAAAFGDSDFHVPTLARLRPDHRLVHAVGRRAARVIAGRWGGDTYTVPTGRWSMSHHACRVLREAGWQPRAIARALAMRADAVERLTADVAPAVDTPQPVQLRCLSCGKPRHLLPPDEATPPDVIEGGIETLPPLLRLGVEQGVFTLDQIRELERALRAAE